jgi:hypothetical protein
MDSRSLWITIGFLAFLVVVGPLRLVAFLHDIGLYPSASEAQLVEAMSRRRNVQAVTCHAGSMGWDFVCEFDLVQGRGAPAVRHREGIRTSWTAAVGRTVRMPVDGPVLPEEQALQWQKDEQKRLAAPVNVRTATIADLQRIPRVDAYRAQVIHASVRHGLVRRFDDLLKIEGIDQAALRAMRTKAYWE